VREKRVTGLMAGIVAAITAVTTMTTASVALSKHIQNAHYVNTLTQNVTYALQQQVSIDKNTDVHLNTLEVAHLALGDELQTIKFRQDLPCHAGFQLSVSLLLSTMSWSILGIASNLT
jgi:hypothetical protein